MAETAAYPYATHLDIKFDPLTLIDVSSLAKTLQALGHIVRLMPPAYVKPYVRISMA